MSVFGETTLAPSYQPTYVATSPVFNPGTAAGVIASFFGSASRTVKILKVILNFSCTETGNPINWAVEKCSSAPTGGTAVSLPLLTPLDSTDNASTASGQYFTSAGTLGTSVGKISALISGIAGAGGTIGFGAMNGTFTGGVITNPLVLFDADKYGKAITLRSATENIQVIMGTALAGVSGTPQMQVTFVYTEQ